MRRSSFFRKPWLGLAFLALLSAAGLSRTNAQEVSITVSNLWSISTAEGRPYLTNASATSYTERGVAYNPLNNHAYIVSRAGTLRVAIVDGDTGAHIGYLPVTGISGGTFVLSTISVAEDGAIYAANLTTGSAGTTANGPYRLYRWADESSTPVAIFAGNPSGGTDNHRYGDGSIDVRGAGIDTEIIVAPQNQPIAVIFKPTDETMTAFTPTRLNVSGISAGDLTKGIAFGAGNTFYGKNNGTANLRFCSYDLGSGTAALVTTYSLPANMMAIDVDPAKSLLAGVESANAASPHNLRVYELASGTPNQIFITAFPPPAANNGNLVGAVQMLGDRIFAIDTQNGVVMTKVYVNSNAIPPSITQHPATNTVLEGGYITLSMAANGTKPLYYQWLYEGTPIPGANTNFLVLTNISLSQTGLYSVVVTNAAGSATTDPGLLSVSPTVRSAVLTPLWQLEPGSRPWLTTDGNQRGIAYNPQTGHLLVVTRSPATAIYIVDAATGDELGTMNVDATITGGTFVLNQIGVAEDGSIYAANLTTGAAATPLKIYRWEFEDTSIAPTVFYQGDPTGGAGGANSVRWGDNMDVRGSTAGTIQILLGSRNGDKAVIISSTGGGQATPAMIDTDIPDGGMGLGIAFGAGDTFWAKSTTFALRQVGFNGTTLHTYGTSVFPSLIGPINVDAANNYLAGLSIDTPDTIQLFNVAELAQPPLWVDTEFFPTDNANANGTGAIDMGGGLLFALDSNNGLMAFALQNPPTITCPPSKTVECGTEWTFDAPTTVDPCDGENVAVFAYSTVTNAACGNTFTATRIWRATNSCGNMAQCSQTVTVTDTIAPTIVCAPDKTAECGAAWSFDEPTASDACGTATISVVSTVTNGAAITRTWVATDGCNNTSAPCSQTVTVPSDTAAPVIACPANITTPCSGNGGATVDFTVTATDSCDTTPTIVCTPASGSSFNVGTTTVNCEATDDAGNKGNCSFTVTVTDSSSTPVITLERQGNTITLSWPESCTTYNLLESPVLNSPGTWATSSATINSVNGRKVVTVPIEAGNKFYILKKP